jgi:hypothetical protein
MLVQLMVISRAMIVDQRNWVLFVNEENTIPERSESRVWVPYKKVNRRKVFMGRGFSFLWL